MNRLCLDTIAKNGRESGLINNFKSVDEYNAFLIKNLLEKAKSNELPRIVDFGAGQSVYDDLDVFNDIKKMLSNFKNIVLLLPSVNIEESLRILEKRSTGDYGFNKKAITSPCNRTLATITIYENNRTPNEITQEILRIITERENNGKLETKCK